MALVACDPRPFPQAFLNHTLFQSITGGDGAALTITAAGHKAAFIIRVPKTGTLAKVGFLVGPVTTAATLKVSFQDVDAVTTGDPDNTVDQYRTVNPVAWTWAETGLMTSDGTDTGSKRSVTINDRLCIVIEFDSAGGSLTIVNNLTASSRAFYGDMYCDLFNGTIWAKQIASQCHFALEYDDGSYAFIPDVYPYTNNVGNTAEAVTVLPFATGINSDPDEAGNIFQVPYKCAVGGAYVLGDIDGPMDLVLYDSNGTSVLKSASVSPIVRSRVASNVHHALWANQILLANTNYRIVLKPSGSDTTNSANALAYAEFKKAAILDQISGGQLCKWTQQTNGGGWTETATRRAFIGVFITQQEDGAASGGESFTGTLINRGIN